jgi:hypothetical protein
LTQSTQLTVLSQESDYRSQTSVTDATVDLAGVPNEKVRLQIDSDGYANRTVVLSDPAQNVTTHLVPLPNSTLDGRNRTFVQQYALDDQTGEFPVADTRLIVQDHFNGSWRTVAAHEFGAENLALPVLQNNETYRLRVVSDGEVRELGVQRGNIRYADVVLDLTVESLDADYGSIPDQGYEWNATLANINSTDPQVEYTYFTGSATEAKGFDLRVYERGNESNVILAQDYGLVRNLSVIIPLTDAQAQQEYVVEWSASVEGETVSGQRIIGPDRANINLNIDQTWLATLSAGGLIIMAGFFGGVRSEIGAIVIPLVAGVLWYLGWLPVWVGGGAIVFAIALGVMRRSGGVSPA